jgi:Putative phage serine protease XkdF
MPLNQCAGGRGWRWGTSGTCYTGKDGKKKAIKQALAENNGKFPRSSASVPVEKSADDGAVEVNFFIDITKSDADRQIVFGWANVSKDKEGNLIVDSHGDTIEPEELENAAYNFTLNFNSEAMGEMHSGDSKGRLIESFMVTPEKLEKMGLAKNALPQAWWVGMHVEDKELFEKVKSGQYRAMSIQGVAQRERGE